MVNDKRTCIFKSHIRKLPAEDKKMWSMHKFSHRTSQDCKALECCKNLRCLQVSNVVFLLSTVLNALNSSSSELRSIIFNLLSSRNDYMFDGKIIMFGVSILMFQLFSTSTIKIQESVMSKL